MSTAVPRGDRSQQRSASDHPPLMQATSGYAQALVTRQKEQFGGLQFGATSFGWSAAAGAGVLLGGPAGMRIHRRVDRAGEAPHRPVG